MLRCGRVHAARLHLGATSDTVAGRRDDEKCRQGEDEAEEEEEEDCRGDA